MKRTITIRNVPDQMHAALKARAKRNGRSSAAELRWLLYDALIDSGDLKIGSALAAFGSMLGGIELDIKRDQTPAGSIDFGDE